MTVVLIKIFPSNSNVIILICTDTDYSNDWIKTHPFWNISPH